MNRAAPVDPPVPTAAAGRAALRALATGRSLLPALAAIHAEMGDVFTLPLPGFKPIVLAGPEAARFVMVASKDDLRWRSESDPVTRLLRHGVLVEDGAVHDELRRLMAPALHRRLFEQQVATMVACVDEVTGQWREGTRVNALDEMRRVALLVLGRTLLAVDMSPDLARLWPAILRTLAYIGPGAWIVWPDIPRPGYARALRQMDAYLFRLIAERRATGPRGDDLLSLLIGSDLDDDLIRDQLLTMLIAGHDTATAMLAWALVALGQHPDVRTQARDEVAAALGDAPPTAATIGQLPLVDRIIKETLRLYPPIHVANRRAARDLEFGGYRIAAGTRVMFSIYITHRHGRHWSDPNRFDPGRFDPSRSDPATARPAGAFSYLPFGGGPRFCIGVAMAQVEAKVVLARLLQRFDLALETPRVYLRMGATLEPAPAVHLAVSVPNRVPDRN